MSDVQTVLHVYMVKGSFSDNTNQIILFSIETYSVISLEPLCKMILMKALCLRFTGTISYIMFQ